MPQEIESRLNTSEDLTIPQIQKKIVDEVYEPLSPSEIKKILPSLKRR